MNTTFPGMAFSDYSITNTEMIDAMCLRVVADMFAAFRYGAECGTLWVDLPTGARVA